MLKDKILLDYTIYFLNMNIKENNKIILKYFQKCIICSRYKKFEKTKISYLLRKILVLSFICSKCKNEGENYLKNKNQLRY